MYIDEVLRCVIVIRSKNKEFSIGPKIMGAAFYSPAPARLASESVAGRPLVKRIYIGSLKNFGPWQTLLSPINEHHPPSLSTTRASEGHGRA